jgi:murein DD-endopeptidase MepM/ murein hydrolase activator NlpD
MNVIFVPKMGGRGTSMRLSGSTLFFIGTVFIFTVLALVGSAYYLGYQGHGLNPSEFIQNWHTELNVQRGEIDEIKRNADENLDALAMRLGQLQAQVIRLDALGDRLTTMAKLDADEFDFSDRPPQGGPSYSTGLAGAQTFNVQNFINSVNKLAVQLEERDQQLDFLETLLMSQNLEQEVVPQGRPVAKGWLSSYFGMRADPFTGKQEMHKGLDFAGKLGSKVVSVASGVVSWASDRYGYGQLVEVDHGHGLSTRYGHAQEIVVKVGDKVAKGDVLALMGSSGRSTGPHVHFEVLKSGKQVDPLLYVKRK